MTTHPTETDLAASLLSARTAEDVEQILALVTQHFGGYATTPVGRANNIGTIRMASNPGLAEVERITNAIDAQLELAVLLHPEASPQTPQQAAQLLGVPTGGLQDMAETARRKLAENLVLSLHESGVKRRPTVCVEDRGIGQHPSKFATTLLSLNEDNKVGKPYTMGTYGQGGSVTFGFSRFTVILSRRHAAGLVAGQDDLVGWTIVFEEETDPTKNILPRYVWVVQKDGTPFSLPGELFPEFPYGTRITHVEYDVQSLQGPFTTQTWQFMNGAIFEPVLPFILTGDRSNDVKGADGKPGTRVITGNATRLANVAAAKGDLEIGSYDSHDIDLGTENGSVSVEWWALVRPDGSTSTSDPAGSYVDAESAVSLTLHGQRQDAERRAWIKDRAKLPFLYKNMVVHINANGLKPRGRRELFAATRERATDSELRKEIYERVADLLRSNEDLKTLNRAEKERLLKRSTAATNDKIRKRLGKFVKSKLAGLAKVAGLNKGSSSGTSADSGPQSGGGDPKSKANGGSGGGHGGGGGGLRNTDDSHLPNVPTSIKFESARMRVAQGRSSYVWVDINAKNGYLPTHDDDLQVSITGAADHGIHLSSRSKLLGGRARWTFLAPESAPLGDYKLHVELMTAGGLLTGDLPVTVVAPPAEPAKPKGGADDETGPDVRWVSKADWPDGFSAKTVGRVDQDDESTIIWVNRDYDLLAKALASKAYTAEQIETRADRYQYPVACGLWLQHFEVGKMEHPPEDTYQQGEMHRMAEAVLVAMDPDVDLASEDGQD